jgi:phosphinothricin acetyltransferase
VTFDLEEQSLEDRQSWFRAFAETGPYRLLVVSEGDRCLGYASSVRFRPKPAYASTVETSIYLEPDQVGRGLGALLYPRLLQDLEKEESVHRAVAALAMPNPESMTLHERLGFRVIGTFTDAGKKFDRYWDITWLERDLQPAPPN